jgi:hypothetical protein
MRVYPFRMKSKLVIKFLLALSFGAAFGELTHMNHEKWHQLGREAFLAHQANQFDQHATAAANLIVVGAIFALGFCAFYEGIAFAILKLVALILPGKPSSRPKLSS